MPGGRPKGSKDKHRRKHPGNPDWKKGVHVSPATQFKPGVSPNPGGRPKSKPITDALRDIIEEIDPKKKKLLKRLLVEAIVADALKGDLKAFQEIADRLEGKTLQGVRIEGPEGGALPVAITNLEEARKHAAELTERLRNRITHPRGTS